MIATGRPSPWRRPRLVLVALALSVLQPLWAQDEGVRLGYAVGFSTQALPASAIDSRFQDLPALGHFSAFFAEFPLGKGFSWSLSPGAANFEPGRRTQFSYQDNLVALAYKTEGSLFLTAGGGVGGAIATLTTKATQTKGVTEALTLRASAFLWSGWAGVGWRFDRWEIIAQVRSQGLFHDDLDRLNALYGAMAVSWRL